METPLIVKNTCPKVSYINGISVPDPPGSFIMPQIKFPTTTWHVIIAGGDPGAASRVVAGFGTHCLGVSVAGTKFESTEKSVHSPF
jgi:hypothetical protein